MTGPGPPLACVWITIHDGPLVSISSTRTCPARASWSLTVTKASDDGAVVGAVPYPYPPPPPPPLPLQAPKSRATRLPRSAAFILITFPPIGCVRAIPHPPYTPAPARLDAWPRRRDCSGLEKRTAPGNRRRGEQRVESGA